MEEAKLPHYGVYARLGISKVCEGIGLFAIIDIPTGTKINHGDDQVNMIDVPESFVKTLPDPIQELYKDFCPLNDGVYSCPDSFNLVGPMWYLNHSIDPSIVIDDQFNLVSLRDIKAGEELTANYLEYSEIPEGKTV